MEIHAVRHRKNVFTFQTFLNTMWKNISSEVNNRAARQIILTYLQGIPSNFYLPILSCLCVSVYCALANLSCHSYSHISSCQWLIRVEYLLNKYFYSTYNAPINVKCIFKIIWEIYSINALLEMQYG